MKTTRFTITRTVTNGRGISAEIELTAPDAETAQTLAAEYFAHETDANAVYNVKRTRR